MNNYLNLTVTRSLIAKSVRRYSSKHKTAMEKLPRDPKKLTSNQPPMLPKAIYSEEEKLTLWKSLGHFELAPSYIEFTKEEQYKLQVGHMDTVEIVGVTKPKEKPAEIDHTQAPYNEIYADGIDENNFTKVRNLTAEQPERWYWVQRLMPNLISKRDAFEPGKRYASGFQLPKEQPNLPYFVQRTRNHLLPVYRIIERNDESRPKTRVRNIEGDVWELEQEIRVHLEGKYQKRILSSVNEVNGELHFAGDYVFDVVKLLEEMGF